MKRNKKQYVIPVFIPHLGCPNDCSFCNQKSISGKLKMPTKEDIIEIISPSDGVREKKINKYNKALEYIKAKGFNVVVHVGCVL